VSAEKSLLLAQPSNSRTLKRAIKGLRFLNGVLFCGVIRSHSAIPAVPSFNSGLHRISVWAFAIDGSAPPRRLVALGRDWSAIVKGEDNEPTGIHVSAGNPNTVSMPGTEADLFNARAFLTKQHGNNVIWEIVPVF